jgi:polysaccharide export outer membrane protein
MTIDRLPTRLLGFLSLLQFASCSYMSQVGPQKSAIEEDGQQGYELIEVNSRADIPAGGRSYGQADVPPAVHGGGYSDKIRPRDSLNFVITDLTELSPFYNPRGEPFAYGPVEVPEDGTISVPYLGQIQVNGRTMADVSRELNDKAIPVSSTAQVNVSRAKRIERTANVIGEVKRPGPIPLERQGITSMDLLAASGGPTESEHLYKYILRRSGRDYAFDYLGFRQHAFPVETGDLLTVTSDVANRFYVMGAIKKATTVPFPVPSPTLADALGAASGFDERRSDPSGVFIFRKGNPDQIFTLNLKEPGALFLTQRFPIRGEDLVYVTEAPLARWNRLLMQLLPYTQLTRAAYDLDRISR